MIIIYDRRDRETPGGWYSIYLQTILTSKKTEIRRSVF